MADDKPKPEHPWAVRGVSQEARRAAADAAHQAGMLLGPWVERAVLGAAMNERVTRMGNLFTDAAREPAKRKQRRETVDPTNEEGVRRLARHMLEMKTDISKIGENVNRIAAAQRLLSENEVQQPRPSGRKK